MSLVSRLSTAQSVGNCDGRREVYRKWCRPKHNVCDYIDACMYVWVHASVCVIVCVRVCVCVCAWNNTQGCNRFRKGGDAQKL